MDYTVIAMIGFLVNGQIQEDVVGHFPPEVCAGFAARINADVRGPRKHRPTVVLNDGRRVHVVGAGCLHACIDPPQPLVLLSHAEAE